MEVPLDIFKKRKRERIAIPKNILANNQNDIPNHVVIKYKEKIDVDKLDQIIRHKHLVMKKKQLDVDYFDKYFNESKQYIDEYNNTNDMLCLQRFLDLCHNYIKIECIRQIDFAVRCKGCDKELESDEETDDNIYTCSDCECINTFLKPNSYSRITDSFTNSEDDTNNFIKVLDKFEGKNEPHPPDSIYNELDDYFSSMNMNTGKYYRDKPLNSKGKKDNTSKKKLWDALENTGNNKYYDESNFIAHKYWGWKLPDITLYREKLISDYQETQNVWNKIKHKYNRSASLGTQFRLYVHLKAIGYVCDREDFKIQDMVESLRIHNDAWKIMCEETGLQYIFVS
jgi:hypothetical protein